jgi:hypothetical protein
MFADLPGSEKADVAMIVVGRVSSASVREDHPNSSAATKSDS